MASRPTCFNTASIFFWLASEGGTSGRRNTGSNKPIRPMAPAFNPGRFTDRTKVENAFRLNCTDVVGRECTALEKADVLSWLLTLKP